MSGDREVNLSLISHTNIGKTTLARTLLERNVGEVRDAAHVTATAEPHVMIETPEGDVLRLWDTPGFGDSARLARRARAAGQSDRLVPEPGVGPLARPPVLVAASRRCATSAATPTSCSTW